MIVLRLLPGAQLTAENLLSALNACLKRVLPNRTLLQLVGLPEQGCPLTPELPVEHIQNQRMKSADTSGGGAQVMGQLAVVQKGYWTAGKVSFWAAIVLVR